MPKFNLTVNDNGVRKRVVVESATEPTEVEVLSALREDISQKGPGTIEAEVDGIGVLEFPAGTSYEVIQSAVKRVIAERSVAGAQQTNKSLKLPPGWSISEKSIWWDTTPPGFKEVSGESATGLILFSPSGRRFQWTNSTPLNQTDIEQLGRLNTERVDAIKNSPDVGALLHRTPTDLYLGCWGLSLLATFAVSWILARRKYNRKSEGAMTTIQEAESNPASFSRASLGVRRLASTLFWLLTVGSILIGIAISDFRFTASLGLLIGFFSWVLIRGIDWIIRGFKFGGYDIDDNR
jgi:hypothetical protein